MTTIYEDFMSRHSLRSGNLLNFAPLSAAQQKHMTRVYATLLGGVAVTGLGVWVFLNLLSLPPILSFLVSTGCLVTLTLTPHYVRNHTTERRRLMLFGGVAFFMGTMLGPYIGFVASLKAGLLPTAFFGTLATFSCFSIAAMFARKRSYLYLGSVLGSVIVYMTFLNFFNVFFRSELVHDITLYVGLMAYMGFVLYDTQLTLEACSVGSKDYVGHALQFYTDFIGIFIKLLQILEKMESKKREEKARRRN